MGLETIRSEARLLTIERAIAHMYNMLLRDLSEAQFEAILQRLDQQAAQETFPNLDPAESDLLSAEFQESWSSLWNLVREVRAMRQRRR